LNQASHRSAPTCSHAPFRTLPKTEVSGGPKGRGLRECRGAAPHCCVCDPTSGIEHRRSGVEVRFTPSVERWRRAPRSERLRCENVQARGDVHCGRNPSWSLSLHHRSGAGCSRVCPERKFAVESFCAADVTIGSLEGRLRHRREALDAVSFETAELKGSVTSKIARERTLDR